MHLAAPVKQRPSVSRQCASAGNGGNPETAGVACLVRHSDRGCASVAGAEARRGQDECGLRLSTRAIAGDEYAMWPATRNCDRIFFRCKLDNNSIWQRTQANPTVVRLGSSWVRCSAAIAHERCRRQAPRSISAIRELSRIRSYTIERPSRATSKSRIATSGSSSVIWRSAPV